MLIGLVGFIGCGKGAAADILVDKHNFTKLSFADTVKDAAAAIFGWPRHLLEGDTDESRAWRETKDEWWSDRFGYEVTPRLALQMLGTEAGRDVFHSDIWLCSMERRMQKHKNVVIADVRFPNEMKFIQDKGGFVVRIKRGNDPIWYDAAAEDNKTDNAQCGQMNVHYPKIHYSEWAWVGAPTDYQLDNIGALSMLEGDIAHMIKVFTGPKNPATIAA